MCSHKKTVEERATAERYSQVRRAAAQVGILVTHGRFHYVPKKETVPIAGARVSVERMPALQVRPPSRNRLKRIFSARHGEDDRSLCIAIENGGKTMLVPLADKKEPQAHILSALVNGAGPDPTY